MFSTAATWLPPTLASGVGICATVVMIYFALISLVMLIAIVFAWTRVRSMGVTGSVLLGLVSVSVLLAYPAAMVVVYVATRALIEGPAVQAFAGATALACLAYLYLELRRYGKSARKKTASTQA